MKLGISFLYYLLNNIGFRFLKFIALIICARVLSLDDFGVFSTLFSLIAIFGAIGVFGMHNTVIRFAEESARAGIRHFRRLLGISFGTNTVLSILLAALIYVLREPISANLLLPVVPLLFGALTILPWALLRTMTFVFRALRSPKKSVFIEISGPLAFVLALGAMAAGRISSLNGIMVSYLLTTALPLLIGFYMLRRYGEAIPESQKEAEGIAPGSILTFSFFSFIVTLSGLSGGEVDRLLLAWMLDPQTAGLYNAAARSAFQLNMFYISFSYAFSPQIVAERLDRTDSIDRDSERASFLFWLAAPVYLAAIGFGKYLLLLFGPAYLSGLTVFLIIATAGYFNLVLGPSELYLRMCGHQRVEAVCTAVTYGLTLIVNLVLIPRIGMIGAGIGAASGLVGLKVLTTCFAVRHGFVRLSKRTAARMLYVLPPAVGALTLENPVFLAALVLLSLFLLAGMEKVPVRRLAEKCRQEFARRQESARPNTAR